VKHGYNAEYSKPSYSPAANKEEKVKQNYGKDTHQK